MALSPEMQRLPPQALEVIRFLDRCDGPTSLDAIQEGTGMSERSARKAIRRLVTRHFLDMVQTDVYSLSKNGRQGAEELRQIAGEKPALDEKPQEPSPKPAANTPAVTTAPPVPPASVSPVTPTPDASERTPLAAAAPADQAPQAPPSRPGVPAPMTLPEMPPEDDSGVETAVPAPAEPSGTSDQEPPKVHRRLSVMMAEEMVVGARSLMLVGFDAADSSAPSLASPVKVILRVEAPGCEIEPAEAELELNGRAPVGPVQFRIRPAGLDSVRIRIHVHPVTDSHSSKLVGGIFFSRKVSQLPTPRSAELKALGAMIALDPS